MGEVRSSILGFQFLFCIKENLQSGCECLRELLCACSGQFALLVLVVLFFCGFGKSLLAWGWYLGATHVHSREGSYDGISPLRNMMDQHKSFGYNFVCLTDHNNWTPVEGGIYDTTGFIAVNGEEPSGSGTLPGNGKVAHVTGFDTDQIINNPGTWQEEVDRILAVGGIPSLAHPRWGTPDKGNEGVSEEILAIMNVDMMEVHNGHHDKAGGPNVRSRPRSVSAEIVWQEVLDAGRLMYGIGTDDAHRISDVGYAWTWVWAENLTVPSLRKAYQQGRFWGSTGPKILDYFASDAKMSVGIDSIQGVRNVGAVPDTVKIEFLGLNGEVLLSVTGELSASYTYRGDEGFVRAVIDAGDYWAFGQPHFIGISPGWSTQVIEFSESAYTVNETDGAAIVTLTRRGGSLGSVSVDIISRDSTATENQDYLPISETVTFLEGEEAKEVFIPILDDTIIENSEFLTLELTNLVGLANLAVDSSATLQIFDNDALQDPTLLAYLPLDDGMSDSSSTIAEDVTGNGNDGALLNGPVWETNGKLGGAIRFDGVDDLIQVPDRPALRPAGGPYTLMAWFKTTDLSLGAIVAKRQVVSPWSQLLVYMSGGQSLALYRSDANNREEFRSTSTDLNDGQWHHFALVIGSNSGTFYIDGAEQDKTIDVGVPNPRNMNPLRIGQGGDGFLPYSGLVDDIRIYKRVLSAEEIQAIIGQAATPAVSDAIREVDISLSPGKGTEEIRPNEFVLEQNFPNPFNLTTTITYRLGSAATVQLVVYDLMGRVVRHLVDEPQNAGDYSVMWNGKDDSGIEVSSGVFLYALRVDGDTQVRKTILLK